MKLVEVALLGAETLDLYSVTLLHLVQ